MLLIELREVVEGYEETDEIFAAPSTAKDDEDATFIAAQEAKNSGMTIELYIIGSSSDEGSKTFHEPIFGGRFFP
jgi:hypothetical protein